MLRVLPSKTRNLAIQLVLQQCCKITCTFFVAHFTEALMMLMLSFNYKFIVLAVAPEEIKVQGQDATLIFEKALRDGYVRVYHSRIFLIGQDRAGKTSLKKALLGLPFDPREESTEGIDPSKCEIDVDRVQNWHFSSENSILLPSSVSEYLAEERYLSVLRRAEEAAALEKKETLREDQVGKAMKLLSVVERLQDLLLKLVPKRPQSLDAEDNVSQVCTFIS